MRPQFPEGFDPRTVCLSVDVEWASPAVLADLRSLLDERRLRATFFVTHGSVDVPGHERGIHPNFRRNGDIAKAFCAKFGDAGMPDDAAVYAHVVAAFKGFAPEARGVRAHSLHYDSVLLPIYERYGIEYDSSYQMPLVRDLRPFWKECGVLEIPIYFNDYFELKARAIGFEATKIDLDAPGLKVFLMHPNILYLNAESEGHYLSTKGFYREPDRLLAARHRGRGIRTLMIELLDRLAAGAYPTMTLGEVNSIWRSHPMWN